MRKIEINIIGTTEDGQTFDIQTECNICSAFELISTLTLFTEELKERLKEKVIEMKLVEIENEDERNKILRDIKVTEIGLISE